MTSVPVDIFVSKAFSSTLMPDLINAVQKEHKFPRKHGKPSKTEGAVLVQTRISFFFKPMDAVSLKYLLGNPQSHISLMWRNDGFTSTFATLYAVYVKFKPVQLIYGGYLSSYY